ncbi:unnamed protein product, partial [Leptidea sinapis]
NSGEYKPGSIYRIALENFVTYKQVELYPGPSLNVIIGPNGTGKSTFVCAIILGLCGKTSVIGRAKKKNVIITRSFNVKEVSMWYIDHKTSREKQVQELIASLNIQLLRSTLSAVGGHNSVTQLEELISARNQQRGLNTTLESNAQLKVSIEAMNERKDIEHKIEICEKKKLWIEYHELREKVVEYCNDKKEADKLVKSHQTKMKPLENIVATSKAKINKCEESKLKAGRHIHSLHEQVKNKLKTCQNFEYTLKDIENTFQEKMEQYQNRETELTAAKNKLQKLMADKEKLVETAGDEKLDVQYDLENNVVPQMRLFQNRIRNLEDVNEKRLEVLRSYSEDAYNAVTWLRENRSMFQQPVYEPMMLEINLKDKKFARYLEATVASRDLVAFTFESTQDMNLFMKHVRSIGLKRVNAVCSQGGPVIVNKPDISQLR